MTTTAARTRRRRPAVLAAAVAAVAAAAVASPAAAYTWQHEGAAGSVPSLPRVEVATVLIGFAPAPGVGHASPLYDTRVWHAGHAVVTRSPATRGQQTVLALYQLQRWDGQGWVSLLRSVQRQTIPTGVNRVAVRAAQFSPQMNRGAYRVTAFFGWYANGRTLGAALLQPNRAGEMVCIQGPQICGAYPGFFVYGGSR